MIRAIDASGNIYGSRLVDDIDQLKQELECQIQLFKGENPYDLNEGIDWGYEIQNYSESRMQALIRDRILSVNHVQGIEGDVTLVKERRTLEVSCIVITDLGSPFLLEAEVNG